MINLCIYCCIVVVIECTKQHNNTRPLNNYSKLYLLLFLLLVLVYNLLYIINTIFLLPCSFSIFKVKGLVCIDMREIYASHYQLDHQVYHHHHLHHHHHRVRSSTPGAPVIFAINQNSHQQQQQRNTCI